MEVLACHLFLQLLDALGFVLRQNLTHHATFGDSHLRFKGMNFVGDGGTRRVKPKQRAVMRDVEMEINFEKGVR